MARKVFNKLVRDKIPEIIKKEGKNPEISVLGKVEFRKALKVKMTEEANELLEAESREEIMGELADIEELVIVNAKENGISMKEIEEKRKKKLQKRGSYKKRLLLKYIEK